MDNKITTVKDRCLQLAKNKGFTYEYFCEKIGMSYGNFKGKAKKSPLNSTAIANILSFIPDVDLQWLITGEGKMLRDEQSAATIEPTVIYRSDPKDVATINDKITIIEFQTAEIKRLKSELAQHAKVLDNAPAAATPAVGATQPSIEQPLRK